MINLYWPVYKKLEKEIVELSNHIHFDDTQITIYSVEIAELLIRCVVEIEAIAKELYFNEGGKEKASDKDLFFDTDCIDLLESKWGLSKKTVIVSSANFYFQNINNKILYPLKKANKRGSSSADWARAYQAVKHNRTKDLSKANIKNLLRAMGALFLLNLYYRDDVFHLTTNKNNFTNSLSSLYDVKVHEFGGESGAEKKSYLKSSDFIECVYLIKWENDYKWRFTNFSEIQQVELNKLIFSHPKVDGYIKENFMQDGKLNEKEFLAWVNSRKQFDLIDNYGLMIQEAGNIAMKQTNFSFKEMKYEAVLNKNQEIYSKE